MEKKSLNIQNIFLDLDNTLVSVEPLKDIRDPDKFQERAIKFDCNHMEHYYLACGRPYLQSFLDWIFQKYKVHIWTAASKDYALFIVDNFILSKDRNNRKVQMILYDKHCRQSKKLYKNPKKLDMLWTTWKLPGYNKHNTILIDDLEEVYEAQPNNCLLAREFNFMDDRSEHDKDLLRLKDKLRKLSNA